MSATHRPRPPFRVRLRVALARVRKFSVTSVGVAALAVTSGTVHGTALAWCQAVVSVATALGVYAVPNEHRESE